MVTIENQWVEFSFFRPGATNVSVAGDFNNWQVGHINLTPAENGYWTARVKIEAGEHKFRYCADGEWFTDYAACGIEPGRFGMDSVLVISKTPALIKVASATAEQFAAA